ncbi:unnamed protein product [Danaus chrysippus]|uniref:(African queen) hypothetical protein n=1 Tax=Danaus chrysippus TaxID=151541 RepID=A0A8J2VUW2_9NEOP|nr:unnamed protein product [Danaus chrysippus]
MRTIAIVHAAPGCQWVVEIPDLWNFDKEVRRCRAWRKKSYRGEAFSSYPFRINHLTVLVPEECEVLVFPERLVSVPLAYHHQML